MYGHYDDEDDDAEEETGPTTLRERVRQAAARQLVHDQPIPTNAPDEGARTARQERRSAERSQRLGDE